jgi:diketogulonate reductase-like aldo/keto reductase
MGLESIKAADPERVFRKVQVGLNWCISKEKVITIPKVSTVKHVVENTGASGWKLKPELASLLDERIRYLRRRVLEMGARRGVRRFRQ